MKKYLSILIIFVAFACNETPNPPNQTSPKLVSSAPADNATNVSAGNISIILTFDKNVTCPSAGHSSISLGNAVIKSVSADLKIVTIQAENLEFDKNYELIIPKGVILGPSKVEVEEIRINFTTKPQPTLSTLCTENPTPEVVALYNYLQEIYGQKTLSATVANVSWNTNEAQWVYARTGKYPAINVFDYIFLYASPAAGWIDYGDISVVEDWHNQGGIVGCMWHWNVPKYEGAPASEVTFRPNETTFRTANAVISGTWENSAVNADLEKIADYLLLLKNKNIPVIWRPLHEAAGNIYAYPASGAWFWWGNDGAEAFKNLWIYMFNYFKTKGLNNMIWVFTTQTDNATHTSDLPFYPGDEYVDIVGRDSYDNQNPASIFAEFSTMETNFPSKMLTLAECGNVAQIPAQFNAGAHWLWFMTWYDYERTSNPSSSAFEQTDHQHGNVDFWNAAWNDERVISRDEIEY